MIFDMVLLLRFGSGQPAAGYLNLSSTSIVIPALGGHTVMNRMSNMKRKEDQSCAGEEEPATNRDD